MKSTTRRTGGQAPRDIGREILDHWEQRICAVRDVRDCRAELTQRVQIPELRPDPSDESLSPYVLSLV